MEISKKKIIFTVPIHIKQGVKIKNGVMESSFEWDIFERLYRFVKSLLPRFTEKEVGAKYATTREGYFWIGADGQIESRSVPEVHEETERLVKHIAMSIEINENEIGEETKNLELTMNR